MIVGPPTDEEEWAGFVVNSPPGTFSRYFEVEEVLDKPFGLETQHLDVGDSDRNLVGIRPFAIFEVLDSLPESHFARIRMCLK